MVSRFPLPVSRSVVADPGCGKATAQPWWCREGLPTKRKTGVPALWCSLSLTTKREILASPLSLSLQVCMSFLVLGGFSFPGAFPLVIRAFHGAASPAESSYARPT